MRETWYVLENGAVADPSECAPDETGKLVHVSGVAVAMRGNAHSSRGVDAEAERAKAPEGEGEREREDRPEGEAEEPDGDAKDQTPDGDAKDQTPEGDAKDLTPAAAKKGYKTRESKAD